MTGELDDIKLGLAFYPIDKNNDIIGLYADNKSIYLSKRISNKWYTVWTK